LKECDQVDAKDEIGFIFVVLIDFSKKPQVEADPAKAEAEKNSLETEKIVNEKKRTLEELAAEKEEQEKR